MLLKIGTDHDFNGVRLTNFKISQSRNATPQEQLTINSSKVTI